MTSLRVSHILGIETSCDECSASIIRDDGTSLQPLSLSTHTQIALHQPYGGVVPEIASRNHLETIHEVMEHSLRQASLQLADLDAIAVTNRPGLVGALLVGVSAAKALAYALKKPLLPIHHLEGHLSSLYLKKEAFDPALYPMLVAIVSGGHTELHLLATPPDQWAYPGVERSIFQNTRIGRSRDDAAGEAFDKTAKLLGLPYPGGRWIDEIASQGGNPAAYELPKALPQKSTLDFSFSGLKTAVALLVQKIPQDALKSALPDLCASIQEAILDALWAKIVLAIRQHEARSLAIVGGVAANSRLRAKMDAQWEKIGLRCSPLFPEPAYCTDNAAMIAAAGALRLRKGLVLLQERLLALNAVANPEA